MSAEIRFEVVKVEVPEGCNVILGITHFIKSVEDIYEAIVNTVPGAKWISIRRGKRPMSDQA